MPFFLLKIANQPAQLRAGAHMRLILIADYYALAVGIEHTVNEFVCVFFSKALSEFYRFINNNNGIDIGKAQLPESQTKNKFCRNAQAIDAPIFY